MRTAFAAFGLIGFLATFPVSASACDAWVQDCVANSSRVAHSGKARVLGGRPAGCPARQWCGCWLALKKHGKHVRRLWLARNWAREGRAAAGPAPGVIAVYGRGRRGGHVGIVTKVLGPGRIVLLSGNDGRRVRERERTTRGVIAWRWAS